MQIDYIYNKCIKSMQTEQKEINKILTYSAYNRLFQIKIDIKSEWVKRYSFKMVFKEEQ